MYFPTIRGSNPTASATSLFLAPRKNNVLSHHHHHNINYTQRRTYLYIPLTWSEFKERFQRWMERAEERIVHVRLLNRKALQQQPTLTENPPSSQSRKRPWRQPFTRTQRQNLDRRKRRPWARWLSNQNKKVASPSYGNSLPLPPVSNKSAAKYTNTVAPSNTPSSSSLMMSGVQTIRSRYQGWKTRRQEQYQRWKIRRREQYQGWKSRRQEQYQGWKSRRQEQYQGWKSRRQEQYQGWKHRRRQLWEETRSRAWDRTRKILLQEYSQPDWFDKFGRPLTSRDSTGRFVNPWQSQSTNGIHSIGTILRWRWQRLERELRQLGLFGKLKNSLPGTETPASVSPLLHQTVPPLPTPDDSSLQFTWIGHSTGMLTVQKDFNILVDPMFSVRASPYQNSPIGVPRDVPPAFTVSELVEHVKKYHEKTEYDMDSQQDPFGKLDICCITHDHYDHMDENSVKDLKEHVQLWVVPLGIAKWLVRKCGIEDNRIVELEWWQQLSLKKVNGKVLVCNKQQVQEQGDYDSRGDRSMNYDEDDKVLTITCCPASHWASRTMWDRNFRLWCSFAFRTSNFNFFYCGDTGYPETFPLFYQIGDVLGPFDFCAIPIAAYEPEEMMKDAHVNPKEAVQIHKELRSRQSVAIHWGSFQLSEEPLDAPPRDLKHAIQEEEAKSGEEINFSVLTHGETCKVTKAIQAQVIYGSVAPTAMSL
ncbi:phospholipase [Nitzschia inconspicua]|uniref:Phospholipase n=1 Tax=Nitzschia inconspicua TaxID=303405 RepID=A0A9K3Q4E7_9STRA|nr:phospholipase [Nitzschia inconspicua]